MMTANSRTLTELAVENAYRFLKTAVVIDDKANLQSRPPRAEGDSSPQEDDEHSGSVEQTPDTLVIPEDDTAGDSSDPEKLYAKILADSFADEGIACTTLRPDDNEDVSARSYKVAESADILILDWILGCTDDGSKTVNLIRSILDGENGSTRLRLISIYTGHSDFRGIAEEIYQKLSGQAGVTSHRPSDFVIQKGYARVVIYGKEYTRVPLEDPERRERIVGAAELPERLVREFAEMTQGILPSVAIAGLSEVREQTHKLLTMFSTSLDSAYLGHRMLLYNPSEAEEQVVLMLASELHSILEEGSVAEQAGIKAIRAWINERNSVDALRESSLKQTGGQQADIDTVLRTLEHGNTHIDPPKLQSGNRNWQHAAHAFEPCGALAEDSNRRFSEMMQVKTRYGSLRPYLTLGTILFSETDGESNYWLCLQPRCDSVRITGFRKFPMAPLQPKNGATEEFEIVVKHRESWKLLKISLKPHELQMIEFVANDSESGRVLASEYDEGWQIASGTGQPFEWVAELKDEHAQRFVNGFTGEFSRVGVNQAEWVRRSGTK